MTFEIKENNFYKDGKPIKLISGAVHYFRNMPDTWPDIFAKLAALGCNCVETYCAWNLHEPKPGKFDFSGKLDIEAFLHEAEKAGLMAIVRPGPYICAEWEFGGLPWWIQTDDAIEIRCMNKAYIEHFDNYLDVLLAKVRPHLVTNGGNVIMLQCENEYGYYGDDKRYLAYLRDGYRARGIDVPLFTSDGTSFKLRFPDGDEIALSARLLGQHNAMNIIASVAIADKFGISRKDIVRAVRMLNPVPHRLQLVDGGDVTIIDDSFNSNPVGARSALEALAVFDGVRVLVTPGMVELGESQSFLNYEFGVLAGKICQYIYVVGEVNYESIYNGVFSTGFDVDKRLIRVKSPEDALFRVRSLRTDYQKIVLLENDLPDNFR